MVPCSYTSRCDWTENQRRGSVVANNTSFMFCLGTFQMTERMSFLWNALCFFGVGEILAYNTKSNQHHCCQSISICIECHPVCVICKQVIKTHIRQRNDSIKRSQTWVHSTILTHTHSHTQTHTPCLPVLKSKHLWTIRIFFCFCFSSQSSGYGVCLQAVLPQSSTIFGIQQGDTDRNLAITSSSLSYSPLSLS